MRNIQEVIDEINRYIWCYSSLKENRRENTLIMLDTEYSLNIIKTLCQMLIITYNTDQARRRCIDEIYKITYGENIPFDKDFIKNQGVVNILIDLCNEGLNILESTNSDAVKKLNEKYTNKFLYFCGFEDTSYIIYITNIHLNDNKVVYDDTKISLQTVNCGGEGILINQVKDKSFEYLPYYDRPYDEDKVFNPEWNYDSPEYIDKWLSYGYLNSIIVSHDSREVSQEMVRKIINNHLYWGFETNKLNKNLNIYKEVKY